MPDDVPQGSPLAELETAILPKFKFFIQCPMKTTIETDALNVSAKIVLAVYGLVFLAAVYILPTAYLGLPLLVFALFALRAGSAFPVRLKGVGQHIYLTDSFLLLSLMLFVSPKRRLCLPALSHLVSCFIPARA